MLLVNSALSAADFGLCAPRIKLILNIRQTIPRMSKIKHLAKLFSRMLRHLNLSLAFFGVIYSQFVGSNADLRIVLCYMFAQTALTCFAGNVVSI